VICANTPEHFFAVGAFYRDFAQTTDEEVRSLLSKARSRLGLQVA
jgi:predicted phosphoribosyltransferase